MDAPLRILVVEDNPDLAANLVDYFEAKGHMADAAGDGLSGLHLAIRNDYDVIVLDLMLPRLDGTSLCRRLRGEAGKLTPILMLTARDTIEDKTPDSKRAPTTTSSSPSCANGGAHQGLVPPRRQARRGRN